MAEMEKQMFRWQAKTHGEKNAVPRSFHVQDAVRCRVGSGLVPIGASGKPLTRYPEITTGQRRVPRFFAGAGIRCILTTKQQGFGRGNRLARRKGSILNNISNFSFDYVTDLGFTQIRELSGVKRGQSIYLPIKSSSILDFLCFMPIVSNHFHIVCYAPAERLSAAEAAARYNRFYAGAKPVLNPDDPYCETVADQMRDISRFMSRLQQQFTSYFNRTRPGKERRRGTLWAQRFKSVILQRDTALWNCQCYVEMNAVRAEMVADPADYRFGSWGEWCATGRHPFEESLCRHLSAYEGSEARAHSAEEIARCFRVEFARRLAIESGAPPRGGRTSHGRGGKQAFLRGAA